MEQLNENTSTIIIDARIMFETTYLKCNKSKVSYEQNV